MSSEAPHVLALETATDACSVAVLRAGEPAAEIALRRPRQHARWLAPMIEEALRLAELEPKALDAIAVSAGPGSFTGLRIGVSTAKGLCMASDAQLVAPGTLEALADAVADFASADAVVVAALNSRRGEVYAAAFQHGEVLRETAPVEAEHVVGWLEVEGASEVWVVGEGGGRILEPLQSVFAVRDATSIIPLAGRVAQRALRILEEGETENVAAFEPRYLKHNVATPPKRTPLEKLRG